MRKNGTIKVFGRRLRRGLSGVLALVLVLGLLPAGALSARAASGRQEKSWAMPYMEQLVDWGVMRGDINGNLDPDRNITRAEFVTLINRAYGYTDVGAIPFTDVSPKKWYADDIAIAYKVGYFQGRSATQAAPESSLVREEAAMLLGRNMMLRENPGEVLNFTDGRSFSLWSRGMIRAITDAGVINGYPDGSFRPQKFITRGEAASMLVRAVGQLVNTEGRHALGSVYGNVTINKSGVTLADTVIVGNLYLTGGIGLGDVLLENVTVIGQIVVSGAGESNSAQSSVILRNVNASEMIVDSINNQFVTVRSEGDTNIDFTSVRTNAYVEDAAPQGHGLKYIELDGEDGTKLQLAGNVKEVLNVTPFSGLEVAQGVAAKVTVDEQAVSSTVTVDMGARVGELNLDTGTNVSGAGDIKDLNVAANGSVVTIPPENVTVRPGITTNVAGTSMDNVTAGEWSTDPRLLTGYPLARDVSSTSADLVFSTNKAGTVYWTVTAVADGSVSEADVIRPPVNSGVIVASGNLQAGRSNTEYTAQVKKLTSGGSYYITAVMVDARGIHSPRKVTAFSVPDDTVPAFAKDYPRMTKVTTVTAQVTVMPTKTCRLYYALLPAGSTAPTGDEFKTNAIRGNLGYGSVDVVKNVTLPINVNSVILEEQTKYDLYLWLTDYDGAKSSKVTKLTFTTADETPPVVTDIINSNQQATATEVTYSLNEPGTFYWAIVPETNESFMNHDLDSVEARVKVISGVGATKKGSSNASKADTDVRVNITGLNSKNNNTLNVTAYKVYYVAMDKAGNYSSPVGVITVRTLDTTDPTVKLEFTSFPTGSPDTPRADTDLRLVFSEGIRGGMREDKIFRQLYLAVENAVGDAAKDAAREVLAAALRQHIKLYKSGEQDPVDERAWALTEANKNQADWVIDYRYATVKPDEATGSMVITFPTTEDKEGDYSALNLEAGASYRFELTNIYDNASTPRPLGTTNLPFRTIYAEINLGENDLQEAELPDGSKVVLDMCLNVKPTTTSKVADTERWDMIMWANKSVSFQVYCRDKTANTPWELLGETSVTVNSGQDYSGVSLRNNVVNDGTQQTTFEVLKDTLEEKHVYEYGIHFTQVNGVDRATPLPWGDLVEMYFSVVAGGANALGTLSGDPNRLYDTMTKDGRVTVIGQDEKKFTKYCMLSKQFTDQSIPSFQPDSPKFTVGSSTIHMELSLTKQEGTIYYVVAPAGDINTTPKGTSAYVNASTDGSAFDGEDDVTVGVDNMTDRERKIKGLTQNRKTYVPLSGADRERFKQCIAYMATSTDPGTGAVIPPAGYSTPHYTNITNPSYTGEYVKTSPPGGLAYTGITLEPDITGLKPSSRDANGDLIPSMYYIYFVLQGNGETYSTVQCYRVTMGEVKVPSIAASNNTAGTGAIMTPSEDAELSYVLVDENSLPGFVRDGTITVGTTGRTMSVIQALTTRPSGTTGPTYFDLYAGEDQRRELSSYITGKGAGWADRYQPKDGKTVDGVVRQGSSESYDADKSVTLEEKTEYYVLAAARHWYGGTGVNDYGFAAVRGIYKPDREAPDIKDPVLEPSFTQVTDAAGTVITDPKVWQANPTAYYYTGTVSVVFSKEVYLLVANRQYEVWATNSQPVETVPDPDNPGSTTTQPVADAVSAIEMLGGNKSAFSFDAANVTTGVTNTFTFTFTKIGHGTSITLFQGGDICNRQAAYTTKKLVLTFDTTLLMSDYPGGKADSPWPGFRATWR